MNTPLPSRPLCLLCSKNNKHLQCPFHIELSPESVFLIMTSIDVAFLSLTRVTHAVALPELCSASLTMFVLPMSMSLADIVGFHVLFSVNLEAP